MSYEERVEYFKNRIRAQIESNKDIIDSSTYEIMLEQVDEEQDIERLQDMSDLDLFLEYMKYVKDKLSKIGKSVEELKNERAENGEFIGDGEAVTSFELEAMAESIRLLENQNGLDEDSMEEIFGDMEDEEEELEEESIEGEFDMLDDEISPIEEIENLDEYLVESEDYFFDDEENEVFVDSEEGIHAGYTVDGEKNNEKKEEEENGSGGEIEENGNWEEEGIFVDEEDEEENVEDIWGDDEGDEEDDIFVDEEDEEVIEDSVEEEDIFVDEDIEEEDVDSGYEESEEESIGDNEENEEDIFVDEDLEEENNGEDDLDSIFADDDIEDIEEAGEADSDNSGPDFSSLFKSLDNYEEDGSFKESAGAQRVENKRTDKATRVKNGQIFEDRIAQKVFETVYGLTDKTVAGSKVAGKKLVKTSKKAGIKMIQSELFDFDKEKR